MTKPCPSCKLLQSEWDSEDAEACSMCSQEDADLIRLRELYATYPKLALLKYKSKIWAEMAEELYTYGAPGHPGTGGLWSLTESEILELRKKARAITQEDE